MSQFLRVLPVVNSKVLGYAVALILEQYGDSGNYKDCVSYMAFKALEALKIQWSTKLWWRNQIKTK